MTTVELSVQGMTCGSCVKHVTKALQSVAGVSRVEVDFAGIDMNMGLNRIELVSGVPGLHAGEATLPVCITGQMDWQVTVLIETGSERIAIPYRFASGGHQ